MQENFNSLLRQFEAVKPLSPRAKSILDILGKTSDELTWTRMLLFFLNSSEVHPFKVSILKALLNIAGLEIENDNDISVSKIHNEYHTNKGNRIDIVIESNSYLIGIENKVEADLYNDLEDYQDTIDKQAQLTNKSAVTILLSLFPHTGINRFKNVTYKDFIDKIRNQLVLENIEIADPNNIYLLILKNFLEHISNNYNQRFMKTSKEFNEFVKLNRQTLTELNLQLRQLNESSTKKLDSVASKVLTQDFVNKVKQVNNAFELGGQDFNNPNPRLRYNSNQIAKFHIKYKEQGAIFYQIELSNYEFKTLIFSNIPKDHHQYLNLFKCEGIESVTVDTEIDADAIALQIQKELLVIAGIINLSI